MRGVAVGVGMAMLWSLWGFSSTWACRRVTRDVRGGVLTWWCRLVSMGCNGGMVVTKGEWHEMAWVKGSKWARWAWSW